MKMGWKVKTLGEVCEVLDSMRKPITKRDRTPGEYPYYGATGILDYVHEYIFDEKLILIGEDGAKWGAGENTAFIAEGKYWVNNHAHVIRPNRSIVLDNWLVYFLNFSDLHKYVAGLTVPKLNQEKMRGIAFPLPPFPEQKRIVAILDKAFTAIAKAKENAEKNSKNARELFESYLQSVFANPGDGWEEKKLEEIAEIFGGYAFKSGDFQKNGKYQVLRMGNVRPGLIRLDEKPVFIEKLDEKILSRSLLKLNDIIITQTGTRKKRDYGYTVAIDKPNYLLNQRLAVIRFSKNFNYKFFLYFSWSNIFKDQFFANETGTVGQGNVGISAVTNAITPCPPLLEQEKIVAKLDALLAETKKLENIYQQKREDLEELKKSVLQKAFTGQLKMEN